MEHGYGFLINQNDERSKPMNPKKLVFLLSLALPLSLFSQPADNPKTFCNPLNLNYRFMVDAIDAREAADPVMVLFKDNYYLFASRSGGRRANSSRVNTPWSMAARRTTNAIAAAPSSKPARVRCLTRFPALDN